MNLRKAVPSVIAVLSILFGMMASMATAQVIKEDAKDTHLEVSCAPTTGIELTVGGPFTIATTDGDEGVAPQGGFIFELDLTCNWSTNFSVNANISDFVHEDYLNVAYTNQTATFDGGRLSLDGGVMKYVGVEGPTNIACGSPVAIFCGAGAPEYKTTVFSGDSSYEDDVIEDGSIAIIPDIINLWNQASPGVSTVTYTGHLDTSGLLLATGTYEAELTLELIVD